MRGKYAQKRLKYVMGQSEYDWYYNPTISRRKFIHDSALAIGGLALASILKDARGPEKLKFIENNTLHLDIAPEGIYSEISQPFFPDHENMIKRILGNRYRPISDLIPPGIPHYILDLITNRPGSLYSAIDEIRLVSALAQVDPYAGMVQGMGLAFKNHGTNVISRRNMLLSQLGYFTDHSEIIPIQDCISPEPVDEERFFSDEFGNKSIKIQVDAAALGEIYSRYAGQEKIVNFSMQSGDFLMKYLEKPTAPNGHPVQILGSYRKDRAYQNISSLSEFTSKYPEKLFVCAAGNFGDDLVEAKHELSSKLTNTLFVGQWSGNMPGYKVMGADIYVDNGKMGYVFGRPIYRSTTSTVIVSSIASVLAARGMEGSEIVESLTSGCAKMTYKYDHNVSSDTIETYVLSNLDFIRSIN